MKNFLLFLFGLISISLNAQVNLNSGLQAYYPFNGNANDESSYGRNGIVYGATLTQDRMGNPNKAYSFNGSSSYIQVPYSANLLPGTGSYSFSGWFNLTSAPAGKATYLFCIDDGDSDYSGVQALYDQPNQRLMLHYHYDNNWSHSTILISNYSLGSWHHVLSTFDKTNLVCKLYIDGNLVDTKTLDNNNITARTDLFFGKRSFYAPSDAYFQGSQDDIRIYNRVLNSSEIQALFQESVPSQVTGTLTDSRDGKTYKTVQIGNQVWMAENLAYLPSVSPSSSGSYSVPYYYVYDYNGSSVSAAKATTNYGTYGALYNWTAAMNGNSSSDANPSGVQGICPQGWHLPSDSEWNVLLTYLTNNGYGYGGSGSDIAKSLSTTSGWNSSSIAGTPGNNQASNNSSGFNAMAAGAKYDEGFFHAFGSSVYFQSSTSYSSTLYRGFYLGSETDGVLQGTYGKIAGFCVRCVKDSPNSAQSDLSPSNFSFLPQTINAGANPDAVSFTLTNNGPSNLATPNTNVNGVFYLSRNSTFGDSDDIQFGINGYDFTLAPGYSTAVTLSSTGRSYLTIPSSASGSYYVFVRLEHGSNSGLVDPTTGNNYAMRVGTINVVSNSCELSLNNSEVILNQTSGSTGTFNIISNTNWTVSDDASWLDVSPSIGSNNGMITITANSANTSTTSNRSASVFVSGCNSTKVLTVVQKKLDCNPSWQAVNFNQTTQVYCKVFFKGNPATVHDKVGAFVNGECRGIGNIIIQNGIAYSNILIQGNTPEIATFKFWKADECKEYIANPTINTNPGNTIGYPPDYLKVEVNDKIWQTLKLVSQAFGWNLVSWYIDLEGVNIENVFANASCGIVLVKNNNFSYTNDPSVPAFLNTLKKFKNGEGYFMKVINNCDLTYDGLLINKGLSMNFSQGWNLIGYPFDKEQNVKTAFTTMINSNNLKLIKNNQYSFDPTVPDFLNTMSLLKPGEGYHLYSMTNYFGFQFPDPPQNKSLMNNELPVFSKSIKTYRQSTILYGEVLLNKEHLQNEKALIGAFVGEECRGTCPVILENGKSYVSMVINGEEIENVRFELFNEGKIYKSEQIFSTEPGSTMKGIIPIPFDEINSSQVVDIYPNPFRDNLKIRFFVNKTGENLIEIFDVNGSAIRKLKLNCPETGWFNLTWDGRNSNGDKCNPGVYLIRFIDKESSLSTRVVLAQ